LVALESKYSIDMSLRHIYGIEWKDNLAWMESMSGPRWDALVRQEERLVPETTEIQEALTLEIFQEFQKAQAPPYRDGKIIVRPFLRDFLWTWVSPIKPIHAVSVYASGDYVWYIEDTSEGGEEYTLLCMKEGRSTPMWKKKGISPHFVVLGKRCFFIEAKNRLVYWKLISCDAFHGTSIEVIYEEIHMSYNLRIMACSSSYAYMTSSSGPLCNLFEITEHTFYRLHGHSKESTRFIIDVQKGQYLMWSAGKWKASKQLLQWKLPLHEVPEWIDTGKKLIVTKWFARRTLWRISTTHQPQTLWKGIGQIILSGHHLGLIQPGFLNQWFPLRKLYQLGNTPPVYPSLMTVASLATDKQAIPFVIIEPHKRGLGKLLVVGYGAYGDPTSMDTTRWEPLLQRGWYICIGCWRGGGDIG
jgi:protease II